MNCRETQTRLMDLLDAGFPEYNPDLLRHLENCPECSRRLEEARALLTDLRPGKKVTASPSFKERTMRKAIELELNEGKHKESGWQWAFRSRIMRAAAVVVMVAVGIVGYDLLAGRAGKTALSPFTVLAQAAEAIARTTTLHIKANMRTIRGGSFKRIEVNGEMLPLEIWRETGEKRRWRVEEPGGFATMDGKSSLQVMGTGDDHLGKPLVMTGENNTDWIGWLKPLMEVESLFNREIERANAEKSTIVMKEATGDDGRKKLILGIEAVAKGDFSQSDYMRNKSVEESDNMRVYTFDAESKALEKLEVYVRLPEKNLLVFETTSIEYNKPVSDELFSTRPPEGVTPHTPDDSKSAGVAAQGPKEVARMFFEALSKGDLDAVGKIFPAFAELNKDQPEVLKDYRGLEIIELGEPFKSGQYRGWIVPYQIRGSYGRTRKSNLGVRNDLSPEGRWQVSGGF